MATPSPLIPSTVVEVAFDSGYLTPAASRTWTDVTDYVEAQSTTKITRGRQDELSAVQASRLTVTFDNKDGRFTPENASGAYYPNVKKGRPIRVRTQWPNTVNLLSASAAQVEGAPGVALWSPQGSSPPTLSSSSTHVFEGSGAMQMQFTGLAGVPYARTAVSGLTIGQQYTVSAYTYGGSAGLFATVGIESIGNSAGMTTLGSFQRSSYTFTATATSHNVTLGATSGAVAGFVWADAIQVEAGATASTFTATTPPYYNLFMGYIDEWPVDWPDGVSAMSTVTVTANSRLARLGRSAPLRSIVQEEYLYDSPVLYWPLGEPSGATVAGNDAPGRSEMLTELQIGTGGTLTFGAGTGPGTDGLTAPVLAPASPGNSVALTTTFVTPANAAGDTVWEVDVWFVTSNTTVSGQQLIWVKPADSTTATFSIELAGASNNVAYVTFLGANGATQTQVNSGATTLADGKLHHVSGRVVFSGGNALASMIVDGGARLTAPSPITISTMPTWTTLTVGSRGVGFVNGFDGTLAHVAIFSAATANTDARVQARYHSGADGFTADASGARVARYARLGGVPSAEVSTETGLTTSVAHKDSTGETPLQLMQEVATTEDGVVFDAADGTLTFHSRSHRYNAVSAFTLDRNAGDIEQGFLPKLDDQHLTNDVTASRANGISTRSTNQASITENGYYRQTFDLMTTSDAEVQARADWEVQRHGTPRVTVPNVGIELTGPIAAGNSALVTAVLSAEIGTRFTLTNLPSQAPATTQDFFIEGISHEIGHASFRVEFNTSPTTLSNVWALDSATYSVLDTSTVLAY